MVSNFFVNCSTSKKPTLELCSNIVIYNTVVCNLPSIQNEKPQNGCYDIAPEFCFHSGNTINPSNLYPTGRNLSLVQDIQQKQQIIEIQLKFSEINVYDFQIGRFYVSFFMLRNTKLGRQYYQWSIEFRNALTIKLLFCGHQTDSLFL